MITKNCANKQSVVLLHFFDLKINLFLEWSIISWRAGIQTGYKMEGLIDGDNSIFYFFESICKTFSYKYFQQD